MNKDILIPAARVRELEERASMSYEEQEAELIEALETAFERDRIENTTVIPLITKEKHDKIVSELKAENSGYVQAVINHLGYDKAKALLEGVQAKIETTSKGDS